MCKFFPLFLLCVLAHLTACAPAATPNANPTPTSLPQSTALATFPAYSSGFVEATPSAPLDVRGVFVYAAGDGSLWLQAAANGDAAPVVERSAESIAQLPAFSPDGARIAYAAMLFLPNGGVRGDIRTVRTDGNDVQTRVRAEADEVVYLYPRFAPDGRLLVTRAENLQTTEERARLEWVDEGGGTMPVMDDARDADVSPDGVRIVFVRYDAQRTASALWWANADGTNPQELIASDVFAAILNPRFSPDGQWIAFSVHGAPRKNISRAFPAPECVLKFFVCWVKSASAHMAPGALWRINVATRKLQPLTDVYDDSPTPAWSNNGMQIAIHDYTGIRWIDLQRQEIYPLFLEDGGSGGFDWYEK